MIGAEFKPLSYRTSLLVQSAVYVQHEGMLLFHVFYGHFDGPQTLLAFPSWRIARSLIYSKDYHISGDCILLLHGVTICWQSAQLGKKLYFTTDRQGIHRNSELLICFKGFGKWQYFVLQFIVELFYFECILLAIWYWFCTFYPYFTVTVLCMCILCEYILC